MLEERETALTVAGSDSGGGAGIQADLRTFEALGVFGTSAVTSLTAQNTTGVRGIEDVSAEFVGEQIDAVVEDIEPDAAKTGMLSNAETACVVAERLGEDALPVVVDPVMVAESGDRLLSEDAEDAVREEVVPVATVVTPNAPEAEVLTGVEVTDVKTATEAGHDLVESGADAALVKGGHTGGDEVIDVLVTDEGTTEFGKLRVEEGGTHGTGCALSSAIAAELAKGASVEEAVGNAEEFIGRAVRFGLDIGEGAASVNHLAGLRNLAAGIGAVDEARSALRRFRQADVSPVVPEVGMNFGVATPYALDTDEVAAFEGRLRRTTEGVDGSGVRLGASGHVARYLVALREALDADVRAACNLRNDEAVREALKEVGVETVEVDRTEQPDSVREGEGGTMEWSARTAVEEVGGPPEAVVDSGAVGKEPMVRLVAPEPDELAEKVVEIAEATDRR